MPYRFKEARERTGMSITEASRRLGISQSAVSYWELGKRGPSLEMLSKAADLYGVTIDYLLGRTENSENLSLVSEPVSSQALRVLHGHPVWHQKLGWGLVDALSEKVVFINHAQIPLNDAVNIYTLPSAFSVGYYPRQSPLDREELEYLDHFWVEPISPDPDARMELRGWYAYKGAYVQNEFGQKFYLDTYGSKWLAFQQKF